MLNLIYGLDMVFYTKITQLRIIIICIYIEITVLVLLCLVYCMCICTINRYWSKMILIVNGHHQLIMLLQGDNKMLTVYLWNDQNSVCTYFIVVSISLNTILILN